MLWKMDSSGVKRMQFLTTLELGSGIVVLVQHFDPDKYLMDE